MKIVMITPDSQMIDRRILLEAKTLVQAGHSVTLLAGFECSEEEYYIQDGIEIHRYKYDWDDERLKRIRALLPDNDKIKMFVNKAFMKLARTFFEITPFDQFMITKLLQFDADVYHVHDLPCLKAGIQAARKKRVKLVYDAHELYYAQDVLPVSLQKKYFEDEKKYIKYPDVVITVNQFIAGLMAERYGVKTPKVIMNCTELPKGFQNNKNKLKEKGNIPCDWKVVLYQGWISPERNIETLIKGVKYFPEDVCLVLIGYGEYEDKLKQIARDINVEEKVFFLGKVSSDEMLHYSTGADIGVIPYQPIDDNHLYCSPNKLFEYVLAGVPIVTEDLPFFRFIKEKYGCILTTNMSSPETFGETIEETFLSKGKLIDIKSKCEEAAKELNWDIEGKKLLDIYNNL